MTLRPLSKPLIGIALCVCIPIGMAWYVYRSLTWKRRGFPPRFEGRYEQPIEPWEIGV